MTIQNQLRPIIAEHGILAVIEAIADRLTEDANHLTKRGPGGKNLALDFDCLAGALREAVVIDRDPVGRQFAVIAGNGITL